MLLLTVWIDTQAPSIAGIITACGSLVTAVGAVLIGYWQFRLNMKVDANTKKVETVHTIVNQQRTDQQRYIIALTQALKAAGINVPVDQSLPVDGVADALPGQPKEET